ncbi:15662_t:CDS:1 [Gigaspora margarita]|uniref:15662_t:CDS:1 n=1 Tax=Gigaspora margarita TaxID=4874 RepID=A0ABN7UJP2_GIGMA|nr:15662_t:CDS:1 [Gigaspora margarita]
MFSIEPKDNNVVVYLNKDDPKNNRFIEKIENLDPKPIIKPFPKEVENEIIFNSSTLIEKRQLYLYVVGGSKIAAFFENRVKTCSAGFWVKKDDEDYVATAGHCARNIPPIPTFYLINRNYLIGKMEDYVLERNDVGFISKDGDEITLKPILRNKFYMEPTQYLLYYIVDSSDITSRGIHVCKSGYATGFTCGEVLAFDTVYKFDSGKIVNNAITVQLIGNSGDSGGSLYRYHDGDNPSLFVDAVGLYIGGTFNVGAAEPIDKIFDFGYDLVTLLD